MASCFLFVAVLLLSTLAAAPNPAWYSRQGVVHLNVSSCAALQHTRNIRISVTNHDHHVVIDREARAVRHGNDYTATVRLPEGGYEGDMFDEKCGASDIFFGVLSGRERELNVRSSPPVKGIGVGTAALPVEQDVWVPGGFHGSLAGTLPPGTAPLLRDRRGHSYSPVISGGAFYFDDVPSEAYRLEVRGSNWSRTVSVSVPKNWKLRIANLGP